jgi:hypothetical protein
LKAQTTLFSPGAAVHDEREDVMDDNQSPDRIRAALEMIRTTKVLTPGALQTSK